MQDRAQYRSQDHRPKPLDFYRKKVFALTPHSPANRRIQLVHRLAAQVRQIADSGGWRSSFRTDADHDSEVMAISIPI
jgi:hypothetical protein